MDLYSPIEYSVKFNFKNTALQKDNFYTAKG